MRWETTLPSMGVRLPKVSGRAVRTDGFTIDGQAGLRMFFIEENIVQLPKGISFPSSRPWVFIFAMVLRCYIF